MKTISFIPFVVLITSLIACQQNQPTPTAQPTPDSYNRSVKQASISLRTDDGRTGKGIVFQVDAPIQENKGKRYGEGDSVNPLSSRKDKYC